MPGWHWGVGGHVGGMSVGCVGWVWVRLHWGREEAGEFWECCSFEIDCGGLSEA